MKNPLRVNENCWVEAEDISAVLRQEGHILVFLKSGKTVNMPDDLSREELNKLINA